MSLPERPKRLGPYDVIAKIGGGGMATVYMGRAKDENGVERVAAIKVIRHDMTRNENVVQMFTDEATLLARLSHPNISRTLEHGVTGDRHFIAMELLIGRTLIDVWEALSARKLSLRLDVAAWICARVADALHHAHDLRDERGVPLDLIHRDVNPSNIFLTYDGDVKLFDFGLAKTVGRRAKSAEGIVKGKLPYLAPEQVMQFPYDRRADIFMLGTTLWELVTMRRLFKRDDDVETVKAVRTFPVPDPRQLRPGFPDALASILRRALERNRDHRYPTAADLARDLDALVPPAIGAQVPGIISAMLDVLFEGERAKQMGWLRQTQAVRSMLRVTLPPPVPVPAVRDTQTDSQRPSTGKVPSVGKVPSPSRVASQKPPPRAERPSIRPPPPMPSKLKRS